MRTFIVLFLSLATPALADTSAPADPVAAADAAFEAREKAAREAYRTAQLEAKKTAEAAKVTATQACESAKVDYVKASVMEGKAADRLAHLPTTSADPAALAAYKAELEKIQKDAKAALATAKAKGATAGKERAEAQAKAETAQAEIDRMNTLEGEGISSAVQGLSALGDAGGSFSSYGSRTPVVTVTLPAEFGQCGFKSMEVTVAAN